MSAEYTESVNNATTGKVNLQRRLAYLRELRELIGEEGMERVGRRLTGAPHRHHSECIHNLSADEQIALRGRTREWWEAMGLPEPTVIDLSQWETDV